MEGGIKVNLPLNGHAYSWCCLLGEFFIGSEFLHVQSSNLGDSGKAKGLLSNFIVPSIPTTQSIHGGTRL